MNFKYISPDQEDDPQGQAPRQFAFVIPGPQPPQQQEQIKMDEVTMKEYHIAKIRNMHANARTLEMNVMLRGLEEMRNALQMAQVADGDGGTTERPPLTPAFDDVNHGKLQSSYLTLTERYVNYCDHMLKKELTIATTNEIKKACE